MRNDEEQIRQLVANWMTATRAGDVDAVLSLVADDVVFLMPGRPPMRKDEFAEISKSQARADGPKIDGSCEIQEIRVLGSWAFMWSKLTVAVTPDSSPPIERLGHTLTIFKKEAGKWVIARDANLLSPVQQPPT
ncbi:MAG TPA: SgcJ/EcaC family oxidoreductase [Rhodocyclaceae bacterium]|nr:SgcJ/EcaC family oxidoreductase [Rhodocyclaceae bacterium]